MSCVNSQSLTRHLSILVTMLGILGCTVSIELTIPEEAVSPSHTDVKLLGQVSGTASKIGYFSVPKFDQEMFNAARDKALQEKEADVLLNMHITTEVTSYILPIYEIVLKVEGTAGKLPKSKSKEIPL